MVWLEKTACHLITNRAKFAKLSRFIAYSFLFKIMHFKVPLYALVFELQDTKAVHKPKKCFQPYLENKIRHYVRQLIRSFLPENTEDEYETNTRSLKCKQSLRGTFSANFQVIICSNLILKSHPFITYYRWFSVFQVLERFLAYL